MTAAPLARPYPPALARWRRALDEGPSGITVDVLGADAFIIGHFRCPRGARQWSEPNVIGPWPLIVMPHHAVEILRPDTPPVLAAAHHGVLYNAEQPYERRLVDPRGDDCTYFGLRPDLLASIVATHLGTLEVDPFVPFEVGGTPLPARICCDYTTLLAHARNGVHDPNALLEPLLGFVGSIVRSAISRVHPDAPRDDPTHARHRQLAHEAARSVAQRFREVNRLDDLANAVGASPYHLARVFRAHMGMTLHQYQTRLRVNVAIQRLVDPRVSLTDLALDLGFSSHSHFTHEFRRSLGVPPSACRKHIRPASRSSTSAVSVRAGS